MMESIVFVVISTLMLTGHSLAVSHTFKTDTAFNSTTLLLFSVSPAFIVSIVWFCFLSHSASWSDAAMMFLKNGLYALVLFLRLESFRSLGAYGGAVLLIMQPIAIALFAWVLLDETLSYLEIAFALLTLCGIWMANTANVTSSHPIGTIIKYVALPATLMALVAIIERYTLLGNMSAIEFFVIDKLIMLPTFLAVYFVFIRMGFADAKINLGGIPTRRLIQISLLLGSLWGASCPVLRVGTRARENHVGNHDSFPVESSGCIDRFVLRRQTIDATVAMGARACLIRQPIVRALLVVAGRFGFCALASSLCLAPSLFLALACRLRFSPASSLSAALLECRLTGPFAWFGGEPGQVGNEAAIVV